MAESRLRQFLTEHSGLLIQDCKNIPVRAFPIAPFVIEKIFLAEHSGLHHYRLQIFFCLSIRDCAQKFFWLSIRDCTITDCQFFPA
ncbi:hypothetical protein N9A45_00195 [bacterium]|nr:hypothetical protein [bacterium]